MTAPVQVVPVTLVCEPTTAACGCDNRHLEWSGVHGNRDERRVYFLCLACRRAGVVAIPGETSRWIAFPGTSHADTFAPIDRLLDAVKQDGQKDWGLETYVRVAETTLGRRGAFQGHTLAHFTSEVADARVRDLAQRVDRLEAVTREGERQRDAQHAAVMAKLARKVAARRARIDRRLARRSAPVSTEFPVLVRGADVVTDAVIYGLVDPREPARVRYVGQALRAVTRFSQHLGDTTTGPRGLWVAELLGENVAPDMVLLERVRGGADLNARERYWIHTLRDLGQADLNSAIPRRSVA